MIRCNSATMCRSHTAGGHRSKVSVGLGRPIMPSHKKTPEPIGTSFRGRICVKKGKKLTLANDCFKFLASAMKKFGESEVVISIHQVKPGGDSIWDFIEDLSEKRRKTG